MANWLAGKTCPWNDLFCVECDTKLYTLTHCYLSLNNNNNNNSRISIPPSVVTSEAVGGTVLSSILLGMCGNRISVSFRFLKTRTTAKRSKPKFRFPWLFSKPNLSHINSQYLSHSHKALKGVSKEFQQLVIRRYLEESIQKKLFCHLQSLQIKTIFQEICEIYSVTVVVYVIYIYGGL